LAKINHTVFPKGYVLIDEFTRIQN